MSTRASLGRRAERAVEDFLVTKGFAILGRNVRLGALEIDLVAQRGELAVIVEVRHRGPTSFQGPLASITPAKRARLVRAAHRLWREKLSKMPGVQRVRIDVAAVTFEGRETRVEYIEAAFTA